MTYPSKVPWCSDFTAEAILRYTRNSVRIVPLSELGGIRDSVIHFSNVQLIPAPSLFNNPLERLKRRGNKVIAGVNGRVGLTQCKNIIRGLDHVACNPDKGLYRETRELNYKTSISPQGEDSGVFRPLNLEKRYTVSWVGRDHKSFKNSDLLNRLGHSYRKATYKEYMPHDQMPKFYGHSVVQVCFSDHEGFGRPNLEAAMCGIPIISTDVGIARDIVSPEYLFDPPASSSIEEYRRIIRDFVADPALARVTGEENRARSLKYSWERVIPLYDQLWEEVAESV